MNKRKFVKSCLLQRRSNGEKKKESGQRKCFEQRFLRDRVTIAMNNKNSNTHSRAASPTPGRPED